MVALVEQTAMKKRNGLSLFFYELRVLWRLCFFGDWDGMLGLFGGGDY